MESKQVIYQEMIYDHTYGNKSGTFYGMVSYAGSSFSFSSPTEEVTVPSCLSLYYIGHVNLFEFEMPIAPGQMEINFRLYDFVYDVKYFGIDDVKITPGDCPPLVCPTGLSPCHKDGICVAGKIECDKISQCPSGEDEADCPISISCDFEQPYGCGYDFGSYIWRDAFIHHLPAADHTMGADNHTGHYMFFTSDSRQTTTLTSPLI
ncbi:unnamed protein product [Mytilus edulis]|uniref:MAM domain-containing protein n=1 Tax=Mytilus edulis TaxID=6550 RepID=A0A8S3UE31_MYTED|nr:unnamed protein product [Mytilus edulis]